MGRAGFDVKHLLQHQLHRPLRLLAGLEGCDHPLSLGAVIQHLLHLAERRIRLALALQRVGQRRLVQPHRLRLGGLRPHHPHRLLCRLAVCGPRLDSPLRGT